MEGTTVHAVVFGAFVGLSVGWHIAEEKIHRWKQHRSEALPHGEPVRHSRLFLLLTPASHPYVWDGIREFCVHLVVYSGLVIPPH